MDGGTVISATESSRPRARAAAILGVGIAAAAVFAMTLAAPAAAAPPSFVDAPTRLYLAPAGSLPVTPPPGFPTVPEGELAFDDGLDLISQDQRTLEVESGESGCAVADPWNLTGCTAVQLQVSHGTLDFAAGQGPSEVDDSDSEFDVLQLPSGAIVRDKSSLDQLPAPTIAIIGETDQVNEALDTIVYTPDADSDDDGTADDPYVYNGANPETLTVQLVPGDPAIGTAQHEVQIRVQRLNGFPEVTVPTGTIEVANDGEAVLSATVPAGDDWLVEDEDNDEPDGDDTLDGPGDEWLLIAWADCGAFEMRASPFSISDDLEELLADTSTSPSRPTPRTSPRRTPNTRRTVSSSSTARWSSSPTR